MNIKQPLIKTTYKFGSKQYETFGADTNHYKFDYSFDGERLLAKITAKVYLQLIKTELIFDYKFPDNAVFFGNGYQSWSTSKEYKKGDTMGNITPIAKGKLHDLAGISSDCHFVTPTKAVNSFYSHCYTYIKSGDKLDFLGSLSEKQGYTVIYAFMNYNDNIVNITKDVEGVILKDGMSYDLYDMVTFEGSYNEVFDRYFDSMKLPKPKIDHLSGYTSWYNYFQNINEGIILRDLDAMDRVKDSVSIFQIDDGYETYVGDWLDRNEKKFPQGMKYIAQRVHSKGYKAGIWIAPFNVQIASRTYKEHPDWVIKDKNGKPILGCAGWGGAYTLDIYNPEVRDYIKHFFDVILNDWEFDMVKLDFLYSQCMYPRNGKSRGTIMCEAMAFLRECCGDKIILGCGLPLGASFGYVDACRIGCDVDLKYTGKFYNKLHINSEIPSAINSITNAMFRRHLNGRAFCNDPDVFFLRYSNLKFSMRQKILLGAINNLFGDVLFVSDNVDEYHSEDIDALKYFFSKSNINIKSVDYATDDKVVIQLEIDGKPDVLWFSVKSGFNNVTSVLGLTQDR